VITVMDLFVAGSETTANSLEFAILYMIHYPDIQKKIQDEIDRVIGKTKFPNVTDKQKYTKRIYSIKSYDRPTMTRIFIHTECHTRMQLFKKYFEYPVLFL